MQTKISPLFCCMQISAQTILPYRHPPSMSTVLDWRAITQRSHENIGDCEQSTTVLTRVTTFAIECCGHVCEASVKLKILPFAVASVSKGFSYADYYYTIKIQYIFHLCGLSGHADYVLCFHPETNVFGSFRFCRLNGITSSSVYYRGQAVTEPYSDSSY